MRQGLLNVAENTGLKGRYQVLGEHPRVICDTAHNREGLELVLGQVLQEDVDQLHFVLGMVNDKNLGTVLPLFPKDSTYYFCRPDVPRGLDAQHLQKEAGTYGLIGEVYSSVLEAYETAKQHARQTDLLYVGGSTFVVAEMPI